MDSDADEAAGGGKPSMRRLTTDPAARNWALARLGVSTGTRIALHAVGNLFRDAESRRDADREFYRERARELAEELGRLKGSVMKAGQMLSLYGQYFLPPEAVEVLSTLQDDTAPVDWSAVAPVLHRALGDRRMAELAIDERPLAAASLGQVHRARRLADGAELVLKIQYPGVADAIESDIRSLRRIVALTRIAPKGLDLDPIFNEVREMLHREVDYVLERHFTEEYAQRLAGDERFIVPRVLPEYCSDQVLALSYEPGEPVRGAPVRALEQSARDALAEAFLELFFREFFDWHTVQSDPHFGNYRLRLDGQAPRWVLLDFGATRVFGEGFVRDYSEMLWGALADDADRIWAGAQAIGLMRDGLPESVRRQFVELWQLVVEPLVPGRGPAGLWTADGRYRWGDSDLPQRVAAKISRAALTRHFRLPPREIVFLHRRLAGVFIMLATLDARIDARRVLAPFERRLADACWFDSTAGDPADWEKKST